MNDAPLHRLYHHFTELPYSLRVLYSSALIILGLGYIFALIYLFHSHAGRAGGSPAAMSMDDIIVAYRGSGKGSKLESALRGPMATMLPSDEGGVLIKWVQGGADKAAYETTIKPILDKRCLSCHDGSNPHLPSFDGFDNLKKVTEQDTGADVFTLVRLSHIHLFGFTMIFFIMGLVFSHAYMRPVWLKCTIIATPFLGIILDVSSWYMTKLFAWFGYVVVAGGGLMGLCFAFMWFVSMYQMWFYKLPAKAVHEQRLN